MRRFATLLIGLVAVSACSTPLVLPPGPRITDAQLNGDHFISPDGARLPVKAWLPEDQKAKQAERAPGD